MMTQMRQSESPLSLPELWPAQGLFPMSERGRTWPQMSHPCHHRLISSGRSPRKIHMAPSKKDEQITGQVIRTQEGSSCILRRVGHLGRDPLAPGEVRCRRDRRRGRCGAARSDGRGHRRAYTIGAVKAYAVDARKEFAESYVFKALKANALYMGSYPMATSIARPLIAKILVDVAKKEKAHYIAHGCTAKGNDQVRFDVSIGALAPDLDFIAPTAMGYYPQRGDQVRTEEQDPDQGEEGDPVQHRREPPGLLLRVRLPGRCLAGAAGGRFRVDQEPAAAPDKPTYVEIGFEKGLPVTRMQEVQRRGPDREAQPRRRGRTGSAASTRSRTAW